MSTHGGQVRGYRLVMQFDGTLKDANDLYTYVKKFVRDKHPHLYYDLDMHLEHYDRDVVEDV